MSDFKLRLSDIFRYIVLGAVQAALCYIVYKNGGKEFIPQTFTDSLKIILFKDPVVSLVVALSGFYLSGYFTQMVLRLFCKGNFMGTGLNEMGKFINRYPGAILNRSRYPHWLYYSKHPDKVLSIYREIMETSNNADIKTEFLYANNLFQGIALSLLVFACFGYEQVKFANSVWAAVIIVVSVCMLGSLSVKHDWALIANKSMIVVLPLFIFITYWYNGVEGKGAVIACCICLCLCIAEQLTRRHIRRIDILIKYGNKGENEVRFIKTLQRVGVPRAFILTRLSDSSFPYYKEQLESIRQQMYPNIKVIVLIDKESKRYDDMVALMERYRKKGLDISHFTSKGSGPACLAYEIRDIFIKYADSDDVAISLDGDDLFATHNVIARIMGRISRTNANICLLTFEVFGDTKLNFAKNHPNEIVRRIATESTEKGKALPPDDLIKMGVAHIISTIGWTKCYKVDILRVYQRLWDKYEKELLKYSRYEDFPDIVALLNDSSRICAVGRTSVLFRKHSKSVTTLIDVDKYSEYIPYYLGKSLELSKDNQFVSDKAKQLIRARFIPYKFIQYINDVKEKTTGESPKLNNYSAKEFYDNFVIKVYIKNGYRQDDLIDGMVNILRDNYKLIQGNHIGYYEFDLPDSLKCSNITLRDIKDAYGLTDDED